MGKFDVLKNYFVERRRWLLGEVKYLDKMIEEWDPAEEEKINSIVNPNKCEHRFIKQVCLKCGIYESIAIGQKIGIIKEADKLDK